MLGRWSVHQGIGLPRADRHMHPHSIEATSHLVSSQARVLSCLGLPLDALLQGRHMFMVCKAVRSTDITAFMTHARTGAKMALEQQRCRSRVQFSGLGGTWHTPQRSVKSAVLVNACAV